MHRGALSRVHRPSSLIRHADGGLANTLLPIGNIKIGQDGIFIRFDATENAQPDADKGTFSSSSSSSLLLSRGSKPNAQDLVLDIRWSQVMKSDVLTDSVLALSLVLTPEQASLSRQLWTIGAQQTVELVLAPCPSSEILRLLMERKV